MNMKNLNQKSKQISYLLRHNPENLKMDKSGWVLVSDLLNKVGISKDELDHIVNNNDKKRFGYNDDQTKIKARQGHSKDLNLEIKYEEVKLPGTYYHGTPSYNIKSILKEGLVSKSRDYVHLSKDIETAKKVALRRGKSFTILEINGSQMKFDGLKIYESENGVILTKYVDSKYIKTFI